MTLAAAGPVAGQPSLDWNALERNDEKYALIVTRLRQDAYEPDYGLVVERSMSTVYVLSAASVQRRGGAMDVTDRFAREEPAGVLVTSATYPGDPRLFPVERMVLHAVWDEDHEVLRFWADLEVPGEASVEVMAGVLTAEGITELDSSDVWSQWQEHLVSRPSMDVVLEQYRVEAERQGCGTWDLWCHVPAFRYAQYRAGVLSEVGPDAAGEACCEL